MYFKLEILTWVFLLQTRKPLRMSSPILPSSALPEGRVFNSNGQNLQCHRHARRTFLDKYVYNLLARALLESSFSMGTLIRADRTDYCRVRSTIDFVTLLKSKIKFI